MKRTLQHGKSFYRRWTPGCYRVSGDKTKKIAQRPDSEKMKRRREVIEAPQFLLLVSMIAQLTLPKASKPCRLAPLAPKARSLK